MQVRRIMVYDGTSAPHRVLGEDHPVDAPAAQRAPKQGTLPRVDTAKIAGQVQRLPHTLLGWVQADGLPMVARVRSEDTTERGLSLNSSDAPLPPGGRRAGLTAHAFHEHMVGQEQRVHTGWLEVDASEANPQRAQDHGWLRAPQVQDADDPGLRPRNASRLSQGPPARPHPVARHRFPALADQTLRRNDHAGFRWLLVIVD